MATTEELDGGANARARTEIVVCDSCKRIGVDGVEDPGAGLALHASVLDALAALAPEDRARLSVRRFSCLMNCSRGCSAAVAGTQGPEKVAYVLGEFAPGPEAAEALIAYALGHVASETGVVPFKTWPQGVKGKFVARVPPRPVPQES